MNPLFHGLLPALVCPFDEDGAIDERSFVRQLERVAATEGVTALVVNGHAGEVTSLTREERKAVVELAVGAADLPIVSGIAVETPQEAVLHGNDAQEAGASALLVLPPHVWLIGMDPGAPVAFFDTLASGVDVPLIAFQYPAAWGNAHYDEQTLLDITAIDGVDAVKNASWEVSAYEDEYHLIKRERPGTAVLCANDEHLLPSYVIGADGSLVGFASIATELIATMLQATWKQDLETAREANDRLYPLTRAFYKAAPRARMHSRIKHGLHLLGALTTDVVRQPLLPLDATEHERVERALFDSGLLTRR